MIHDAVESVVDRITFKIKETLAGLDPEVVVDIIEKGILLTGGGALISGLDKYLTHHLGVTTTVCTDPLLAVARGGAITLEDSDFLNSIQLPARSG